MKFITTHALFIRLSASIALLITASATLAEETTESAPTLVSLEKRLHVTDTHLIVPVTNHGTKTSRICLGLYDGESLVQSFNVSLPQGDESYWLAAYPLTHFGLGGKQIRIAPVDGRQAPESSRAAFDLIKIGVAADAIQESDYHQPYRNQFHVASRRGWNNDPNGMVYHDGVFHLYYQHNPFGISWGNMHWGHFQSKDLVHWEEMPLALYQKTVGDMAFSGGGFVDFNNSAGLGKNTLFVAFTSTGRGECLAYSKDGGLTFTELEENPVVEHNGRDPKIIWYAPEQKWVMAIYDNSDCAETESTPPAAESGKRAVANIAFWESKNLRQWTRTGAFTDPDRNAVFECPELFELPLTDKPGESRWIVYGAQNRYFIGHFDGKTFHKESGPHGSQHGAFYAAQTFSDVPDGRRIQIGWVRTAIFQQQFPDQIVNQALTLPHEMTLRQTDAGLRVFFTPVEETNNLRAEVLAQGTDLNTSQANKLLQACRHELTEVVIEFEERGPRDLLINGIDAGFEGRNARIFTDRTFNEIYADGGSSYELRARSPKDFESTETRLHAEEDLRVKSLKIYRLSSIWAK